MSETGALFSGGGEDREGRGTVWMYWCPGCDEHHQIIVGPGWWGFNGDVHNPTVEGSVLVRGVIRGTPDGVCHSFIREGRIQYLADCTHELAEMTVPMLPFGQPRTHPIGNREPLTPEA